MGAITNHRLKETSLSGYGQGAGRLRSSGFGQDGGC